MSSSSAPSPFHPSYARATASSKGRGGPTGPPPLSKREQLASVKRNLPTTRNNLGAVPSNRPPQLDSEAVILSVTHLYDSIRLFGISDHKLEKIIKEYLSGDENDNEKGDENVASSTGSCDAEMPKAKRAKKGEGGKQQLMTSTLAQGGATIDTIIMPRDNEICQLRDRISMLENKVQEQDITIQNNRLERKRYAINSG